MNIAERLHQLRELMQQHNIDYYFVPAADQHDNEYVPDCWQRRSWISGFTGSAGDVLIGLENAYLWTDPRYFLQAELQLDPDLFTVMRQKQGVAAPIDAWFIDHARNKRIGVDPALLKLRVKHRWQNALESAHSELIAIEDNLVDQIWHDRPELDGKPITLLDKKYTGLTTDKKLQLVREALQNSHAESQVITMLDAIAWLFNLRGSDIAYNPLAIAYAIVTPNDATLFISLDKVSQAERDQLTQLDVKIRDYTQFSDALNSLSGRVLVDPQNVSWWTKQQLSNADVVESDSAITLAKAIKNPTEIRGMYEAHRRDAIAEIKFLHWLENNWEGQTELSAADQLESFRAEDSDFRGLSFQTISGMAEHGAIIHYAVTNETSTPISDCSLYLVDSGGQYLHGTTDITRTIHLGEPTDEQKLHYTMVLQGHLAIRHLLFPAGINGEHINAIAHLPMWQRGMDFGHGTGHGVGCYLCVHEGPQRIAQALTGVALQPGMIVSNEPGLYFEGKYGIRIENLCLIEKKLDPEQSATGHGPFLGFDDLTLVPYARNLIDTSILSAEEIAQVNEYHQRIFDTLHKDLPDDVAEWLAEATKPL